MILVTLYFIINTIIKVGSSFRVCLKKISSELSGIIVVVELRRVNKSPYKTSVIRTSSVYSLSFSLSVNLA